MRWAARGRADVRECGSVIGIHLEPEEIERLDSARDFEKSFGLEMAIDVEHERDVGPRASAKCLELAHECIGHAPITFSSGQPGVWAKPGLKLLKFFPSKSSKPVLGRRNPRCRTSSPRRATSSKFRSGGALNNCALSVTICPAMRPIERRRSRSAPPNRPCTGTFRALPLISSKAFVSAAMACWLTPPVFCPASRMRGRANGEAR